MKDEIDDALLVEVKGKTYIFLSSTMKMIDNSLIHSQCDGQLHAYINGFNNESLDSEVKFNKKVEVC